MTQDPRNSSSRQLALYRPLLQLYPRAYLRRHREELLQNFQDLEQALPSRTALWCFIAKDLAVSLRSQFIRTLWGQTAIVVTVLSLMLMRAHQHPGQREHSIWGFCIGYVLGWFIAWFGRGWWLNSRIRSHGFAPPFCGQLALLVSMIAAVIATTKLLGDLDGQLVLVSCYGGLLAWFAGWTGHYKATRT